MQWKLFTSVQRKSRSFPRFDKAMRWDFQTNNPNYLPLQPPPPFQPPANFAQTSHEPELGKILIFWIIKIKFHDQDLWDSGFEPWTFIRWYYKKAKDELKLKGWSKAKVYAIWEHQDKHHNINLWPCLIWQYLCRWLNILVILSPHLRPTQRSFPVVITHKAMPFFVPP